MTSDRVRVIVEATINLLRITFEKTPEIFLTEDDVRCYLYRLLYKDFGTLKSTEDGGSSIALHSEVRWYGNSGKLKFRSDLVILDVSSLRIKKDKFFRLPSKGYGFNRLFSLIEIKFFRKNARISKQAFEKTMNNERERIKTILSELSGQPIPRAYLLVLTKHRERPGFVLEEVRRTN